MPEPLGQHFLKNTEAIEKIVAAANPQKGDIVIEIGPGAGALTLPLLELCAKNDAQYIGIEKDAELATALSVQLASTHPNAKIYTTDVLAKLPDIVTGLPAKTNYKLIGNLPYYITGAIMRTAGELLPRPALCVFMVQREVGERICAKTGEMSLLSAAVQLWATPKLLFKLPPKDFDPPPKVWSAVISLITRQDVIAPLDAEQYYRALPILFKQPRKTLFNNLREGGVESEKAKRLIEDLGLPLSARPQDLSVEHILALTPLIS